MDNTTPTVESPVDQATKEVQDVLAKYNLKVDYRIAFPQFGPNENELPDDVLLALKLLRLRGMKVQFILSPKPADLPAEQG